jgi:hypothetical protein
MRAATLVEIKASNREEIRSLLKRVMCDFTKRMQVHLTAELGGGFYRILSSYFSLYYLISETEFIHK